MAIVSVYVWFDAFMQSLKTYSMKRYFQAVFLFFLIVGSNTSADSTFDLTQYQGKVLVLDFWASWCVPCRRSFPWMNSMQQKYGDDGLVIVGVNMDADPADANAVLESYPADFEIIYDPDGELARAYDVIAMPSSYIIDRNGVLVTRHLGFKVKRQDEYEAILLEALGEDKEKR